MSSHIEYITELVEKPLIELEELWKEQAIAAKERRMQQQQDQADGKVVKKATISQIGPTIAGITTQTVILSGESKQIHRVFVKAKDSFDYTKLGWVLRTDCNVCMVCMTRLTRSSDLFSYLGITSTIEYHCRGCGNLVCGNCSNATTNLAVIKELRIKNEPQQRVCSQCFWGQEIVEVTPMKQPLTYVQYMKEKAIVQRNQDGSRAIDDMLPRVWKYGSVTSVKVTPEFVIKAYNTALKVVYVNVCTSYDVPYNLLWDSKQRTGRSSTSPTSPSQLQQQQSDPQLTKKGQDLYVLVGEPGITQEGCVVYDAVVHTAVGQRIKADSTQKLLEKVSQEILGVEAEETRLFSTQTQGFAPYKARQMTGEQVEALEEDRRHWRKELKKRRRIDAKLGVHRYETAQTATAATAAKRAKTRNIQTKSMSYDDDGMAGIRNSGSGGNLAAAATNLNDLTPQQRAELEEAELYDGSSSDEGDDVIDDRFAEVYIATPSIAAFFHMEQIKIDRSLLNRPPGNHERRWQKYEHISQSLVDGTLSTSSNKRAKKIDNPKFSGLKNAIFITETSNSRTTDVLGDPIISYGVSLHVSSGFTIEAFRRTGRADKKGGGGGGGRHSKKEADQEEVEVCVTHHSIADLFVTCGVVDSELDEVDPFLLVCKKSVRKTRPNGVKCRVYVVSVASSYIEGLEDLTGRKITTPAKIALILTKINRVFEDNLDIQQYKLHHIARRPAISPAMMEAYFFEYERKSGEDMEWEKQMRRQYHISRSASQDSRNDNSNLHQNQGTSFFSSASHSLSRSSSQQQSLSPRRGMYNQQYSSGSGGYYASASDDENNSLHSSSQLADSHQPQRSTSGATTGGGGVGGIASTGAFSTSYDHSQPSVDIDHDGTRSEVASERSGASSVTSRRSQLIEQSLTPEGRAQLLDNADSRSLDSSDKRKRASQAIGFQGLNIVTNSSRSGDTRDSYYDNRSRGDRSGEPEIRLHPSNNPAIRASQSFELSQSASPSRHNHHPPRPPTSAGHTGKTAHPAERNGNGRMGGNLGDGYGGERSPSRNMMSRDFSRSRVVSALTADEEDDSGDAAGAAGGNASIGSGSGHGGGHGGGGGGGGGHYGGVNGDTAGAGAAIATAGTRRAQLLQLSIDTHQKSASMDRQHSSSSQNNSPRGGGDAAAAGVGPPVGKSTSSGLSGFFSRNTSRSDSATPRQPNSNSKPPTTPRTPSMLSKFKARHVGKKYPADGTDVVKPKDVEYIIQLSVNRAVSKATKSQAAKEPKILFGWQIRLREHNRTAGAGLYVITAVQKHVLGHPEFRLTNLIRPDFWVKLNFTGRGDGLDFAVVRKVIESEDITKA